MHISVPECGAQKATLIVILRSSNTDLGVWKPGFMFGLS